jgi:hypothetical protein
MFVLFISLFSTSLAIAILPSNLEFGLDPSVIDRTTFTINPEEMSAARQHATQRFMAANREHEKLLNSIRANLKTIPPILAHNLQLSNLPDEIVDEDVQLKKLYAKSKMNYLNAFVEFCILKRKSELELYAAAFYGWSHDDIAQSISNFKCGKIKYSLLHLILENCLNRDFSQDDKYLYYLILNKTDDELIGGVRIFYNKNLGKIVCNIWFNKGCEGQGLDSSGTQNVTGQFCCELDI